jgi:D-sedoheptulose 7-phosphate isomerase
MNDFVNKIIKNLSDISDVDLQSLKNKIRSSKSIIVLGNGGSNAIASHMAEDYTKALKIPSLCFSDAARLTCYANDYGYENAFVQFLKEFSTNDHLVVLISSSGNSSNILKCASYCSTNNINYISLSGFKNDNKLKIQAETDKMLHFWVDSNDYGLVECCHEIILHSVI